MDCPEGPPPKKEKKKRKKEKKNSGWSTPEIFFPEILEGSIPRRELPFTPKRSNFPAADRALRLAGVVEIPM